jgi:thioredoxin 1
MDRTRSTGLSLPRTALLPAALAMLCMTGGCAHQCDCGSAACPPGVCLQQASQPVLVDFYTPQCPGCQKISTTIDTLAVEYEGRATVKKLDVYRHPDVADAHSVRKLPTVVLFIHGKEEGRWVGPRPGNVYRAALEKAVRSMPPSPGKPDAGEVNWTVQPEDCPDGQCRVPEDRSIAKRLLRIATP